jgi:hypothetical protein
VAPPQGGSGECRVPVAPAASCAKCSKAHELVTTVAPGSPGIPARDGFNGVLRALPGHRAFLPPSPTEMSSANLTPASGRQDHTTSPSADKRSRQQRRPRPSHPNLTFVTIAKRPLCVGRDGEDEEVICVKSEPKYFCQGGWTGKSLICPSGRRFTGGDDLSTRHHRAQPGDPSHKTLCKDGWMPGSSPGMTMARRPSGSRRYIGGFTPSAPTTTPPASGASFFMTTNTLRPTTSWSAGALTKETTVASVGIVIVCSPPL